MNTKFKSYLQIILSVLGIILFLIIIVFSIVVFIDGNLYRNIHMPVQTISPNSELIQSKGIEWLISLFGILMTLLIVGFSITTLILQKRNNDEIEKTLNEKFNNYKNSIDFEKLFSEKLKSELNDKYANEIFRYTRAFTKESLMLLPEYHILIYEIVDRTAMKFMELLDKCLDNPTNKRDLILEMRGVLWNANYQINAASKIFFSPKDKEGETSLEKGLEEIVSVPFTEVLDYLNKLLKTYEDKPLYASISETIEKINLLN